MESGNETGAKAPLAASPLGPDEIVRMAEALRPLGLELYHVDFRRGRKTPVVTVTIDSPAGVTLDDCERTSRALDALMDELLGSLPGAYILEVESPGLDRPLHTVAQCLRFTGRRVTVRLHRKVEGTGKLKGVLEKVDGDELTVLDEDQHRRYTVRFGDVKLARLIPEI